nr:uncharacterized protein LOC119180176 [Rhipicephalus microplus]
MDAMLKGLKGVRCYVDDIFVTGKTTEDHLANLKALLERLQSRGVRVKKEKCSFFRSELHYLGHKISAEGIAPLSDKVDALLQAPEPKSKKQLESLLGVINYYSKFVPQLATIAKQFYRLLQKKEFKHFVQAIVARHVLTAHYHPSSNALAERFIQTLKDALRKGSTGETHAVTFKDDEGKKKMLAAESFDVKIHHCKVVEAHDQDVRLKMYWLLHCVPGEDVRVALMPYGKVTEVSRVKWKVQGCNDKG